MMNKLVLPVTAAVLAMVVGAGAGMGCSVSARACEADGWAWSDNSVKELRELHIAHKAESPLVVVTGNGSISIVKGGTDTVDVRAQVRARDQERLGKIKVVAVRGEDGVLTVKAQFPDGKPRDRDSVSLEIIIPDARDLTLRTSNGSISADGFSGKAVFATSNGAITLNNHAGEAVLDTSNGGINGTNITGGITADTSNGGIKLQDVGTPVVADTSNGGVDISLSQSAVGPVKIDTSNGKVNLAVGASFGGTLIADTSNGTITLNTGDKAWKVNMKGKTYANIDTGVSGDKSVVDTSNGSVTISTK